MLLVCIIRSLESLLYRLTLKLAQTFYRDVVRFSEWLHTLGASPLGVSIAVFICALVNGMRDKWTDLLNILYARPDQWLHDEYSQIWDASHRCILKTLQWIFMSKTSAYELLGWSPLISSETFVFSLCLAWRKLIPGSFKAASYVGQVIFGFWFSGFFYTEHFSDSLAAMFLPPFVRITLATVYGAKCSLLSPSSYLVFRRQLLNIPDGLFQ